MRSSTMSGLIGRICEFMGNPLSRIGRMAIAGEPQPRGAAHTELVICDYTIEELHVFFDHPIQLVVAHNQQVVETFTPHTADKPLADRIRSRRTVRSS